MKGQARNARGRSTWAIFRWPLLLAVISVIGLVAALLTEGSIDLFWSILVSLPILVIALALRRRAR